MRRGNPRPLRADRDGEVGGLDDLARLHVPPPRLVWARWLALVDGPEAHDGGGPDDDPREIVSPRLVGGRREEESAGRAPPRPDVEHQRYAPPRERAAPFINDPAADA